MPLTSRRITRRRLIGAVVACAVVGVVAIVAVIRWDRGPPPQSSRSEHDVPLGVEEAVIIRYAGPRLVARPYRRGASVNVRIAEESLQDSHRVYDVRYVVNLPGEFDLKDYLGSADGQPLDGLPSFKIRGLTRLTKDIETRIRELEDVGVHIGHWYYETLAGLGAAWVLWLAGLIWIGRPKRAQLSAAPPPKPSLAEQIARYLESLAGEGLSLDDKARLEILLVCYWRQRLGLADDRMAAACRQIRVDPRLGPAYEALEAWLHDPQAPVGPADVRRLCDPSVER